MENSINITNLHDKIYTIRGEKVMLDSDLAEIYGYTTKAFNQQVKNNINKFDLDFMFQLTREEVEKIVRSSFLTSPKSNLFSGQSGGSRYLPYAFTESGIYMLMTILKGELATKQSKALIRIFRAMKDYIVESRTKLDCRSDLQLAIQVTENTREILTTKNQIAKLDTEIKNLASNMSDVLKKSDISPVLLNFDQESVGDEFIFLDGELLKAADTYINIYAKAKTKVYIIDNYIGIQTLRHLQKIDSRIEVVIFSDNLGNYLHAGDYQNFKKEFPEIKIRFIRTMGKVHDRFIVLDYGLKNEKVYHCGPSAKDAGNKIAVVSKIKNRLAAAALDEIIGTMLNYKTLILRP